MISPQYELLRRGYIPETCASQRPKPKPEEVVLLSLDCETVQSQKNFHALARVTLVGRGVVLLDLLVRPPDPIVDYRTKWSGITEELLEGVDTTLEQAREKILEEIERIRAECPVVLAGHSLNMDIKSLQLTELDGIPIIDTSVLYTNPSVKEARKPPRLKSIAQNVLNRTIQEDTHCSEEDAFACLDIVMKLSERYIVDKKESS